MTLSAHGLTYTAETKSDDLTISQVASLLLAPLLIASGFHPDNIEELFKEGNPIYWDTGVYAEQEDEK